MANKNNVWYQRAYELHTGTMDFVNPLFERMEVLENYCMTSVPFMTQL
jgi:hypothetical protein